jgi:alpha-tubulin suppressor-like RCC1 family protein
MRFGYNNDVFIPTTGTGIFLSNGTLYGVGINFAAMSRKKLSCIDTIVGQRQSYPAVVPYVMPSLEPSSVKRVAAVDNVMFALDQENVVWASGLNNQWVMSATAQYSDILPWTRISLPLSTGNYVTDIALSNDVKAVLFLVNDGSLIGNGNNLYGNLGLNDTISRKIPTIVNMDFIDPIVTVYMPRSSEYSLILGSSGNFYFSGNAKKYLLGGLNANNTLNFTQVVWSSNPVSNKVLQRYVSEVGATFMVFTDGTLWAWGTNDVSLWANSADGAKNKLIDTSSTRAYDFPQQINLGGEDAAHVRVSPFFYSNMGSSYYHALVIVLTRSGYYDLGWS